MQLVLRTVVSVRDELVKLFVVIVSHFLGILSPQCSDSVDLFRTNVDIEGNKVTVSLNDA